MDRIKELEKSVFGSASSSSDPNRLYSILLDTKASTASENMYDIAEKILGNEKDNAKFALDQLWALKKNLTDESENSTVDMLITFYQDKMNIVRNKEEHIKKISKDSRELLEEKRKRDSEIANVKQEISECATEIERLNAKHHQLSVKEQELTLIGTQLDKELQLNTNEVVNGLYEIILIGQEGDPSGFSLDEELKEVDENAEVTEEISEELKDEKKVTGEDKNKDKAEEEELALTAEEAVHGEVEITEVKDGIYKEYEPGSGLGEPEKDEYLAFPKSVVKTTTGNIIGEYYYDQRVYKNKRSYIYNSRFFSKKLEKNVLALEKSFDEDLYAETRQMIQDAFRRIPESKTLHFEISTNEILNKKCLKELWALMTEKNYGEVIKTSNKLKAKIINLGKNYNSMLKEQMERYSGQD